jgi:hypothetical protein
MIETTAAAHKTSAATPAKRKTRMRRSALRRRSSSLRSGCHTHLTRLFSRRSDVISIAMIKSRQ